MTEIYNQMPFDELPEALVEEMLSKSEEAGDKLYKSFKEIKDSIDKMRRQLEERMILKRDNEFVYPVIPTTCGVDGAYVVERLLATDIVACAAVAIEGLAPPSEHRYWEKPTHRVFINPERHNPDIGIVIRGLMFEMELELANKAPHDIVFLDGSLTTPLIYMNQAINRILEWQKEGFLPEVGNELYSRYLEFLSNYKTILHANRNDKLFVSLPKYTTKRELGDSLGWPSHYDDRAILTNILAPGELISPIPLGQPQQPWHIKNPFNDRSIQNLINDILSSIDSLYVMYYRPHSWTPALRIEVPYSIATNNYRIAVLLQGIRYQSGTPGIMEPYPLYIADRMVKKLGNAIPAFRQTATKRITELHQGDIMDIFFSMHSYRTETGR